MMELLHGGMVLPSALSLCCAALGERRRRITATAVAAVMLAAMVDVAVAQMLAPVLWCGILLVAALLVSFEGARRSRVAASGGGSRTTPVSAHHGLGLVIMAALVLLASPAGGHNAALASPVGHGNGHGSTGLALIVIAGVAAYLVLGATMLLPRRSHPSAVATGPRLPQLLARLDVVANSASILAMATMALVVVAPGAHG